MRSAGDWTPDGWSRVRPVFLVALAGAGIAWWLTSDPAPPTPAPVIAAPKASPAIVDTLAPGETLSEMWHEHALDPADLHRLVEAGQEREGFSWRRLRPGTAMAISTSVEGELTSVELAIDRDRRLVAEKVGDTFSTHIVEAPMERRRRQTTTCIDNSLWEAFASKGEDPTLALPMADILGGVIDFYTDLRTGDCLAATFTVDEREDGSYRLASIDAIEMTVAGKRYEAYRFSLDGERFQYYDADGESLRRMFLRSPLKFTRISSRFGMRFHPILRRRRPHNGVDYAAPTGTPVQASADGVVVQAGRNGGYGIFVKLRHGRRYTTSYAHLSRIASGITPGVRVEQGQVIGFVGSTGLSTGPHLDYRFTKDGRYVDPLSVDLPTVEPLQGQSVVAFNAVRDAHRARLPALDVPPQPEIFEASDGS